MVYCLTYMFYPGIMSLKASSCFNVTKLMKLKYNLDLHQFSREGNGTPLQYSCLENPMDGGASWAAVHGVAKSRTRLSNFTFTFHFHALKKEMATHSSVLAWRIPGTGEPGGLPSMGSHRVGHDWSDLAAAAAASVQFSSFQSLSRVQLFKAHGPQHARPPCPSLTPRVYSNSCPLSWWCHPTVPFSGCPQSFPASGPF